MRRKRGNTAIYLHGHSARLGCEARGTRSERLRRAERIRGKVGSMSARPKGGCPLLAKSGNPKAQPRVILAPWPRLTPYLALTMMNARVRGPAVLGYFRHEQGPSFPA